MLLIFSPFEVDQRDDGALGRQLGRVEQRPDEAVDLPVLRVVSVVVRRDRVMLRKKEDTFVFTICSR